MTSEEMERAIEILLNNQARYELQLEQTNRQLRETNREVSALTQSVAILAQSHREFVQVVLQHIESQGEINKTMRDSVRELSNALKRHVTEDHGGKS